LVLLLILYYYYYRLLLPETTPKRSKSIQTCSSTSSQRKKNCGGGGGKQERIEDSDFFFAFSLFLASFFCLSLRPFFFLPKRGKKEDVDGVATWMLMPLELPFFYFLFYFILFLWLQPTFEKILRQVRVYLTFRNDHSHSDKKKRSSHPHPTLTVDSAYVRESNEARDNAQKKGKGVNKRQKNFQHQ
jgi:hypothetical protein